MNIVTSLLYFGQLKKARPGFFFVFEYLIWASISQKHNGWPRVRLAKEVEDVVVDDDIFLY